MTAAPPPEYVLARSVLLDALQALDPHLDAVVLVGAQAVYLHTGDAELIVVPTTTDADLALYPAKLMNEPLLEDALRAAGFELAANPGAWRGRSGVAVDLMVPEALSGRSSRRSARLPIHGDRAARRTSGLEPALVDNDAHVIVSFEAADPRKVRLRVAHRAFDLG
jgi:Nucleotidyltransferase